MFFVVLLLIGALCVPASAAIYTQNYTNNLLDPFVTRVSDSNGAINFIFEPTSFGVLPEATVSMYAPAGTVGRVMSMIACSCDVPDWDPEARTVSSSSISNNVMTCTARLQWYSFATKVNFYAARSLNGVTNAWDYYYTAEGHKPCSIEHELMVVKGDIAGK